MRTFLIALVFLAGNALGDRIRPDHPANSGGRRSQRRTRHIDGPDGSGGRANAHVVSSVLTTGTAGLYQITIELPANLPAGAATVQASIGGTQTQASAALLIGLP